jgi:hypothetical protein
MKKFPLVIEVMLIGIMFASQGCYFDNEETLYPNNVCDTVNVKYSTHIIKILDNQCYECHDNANAPISGNDYSWEGYANISGYLAGSSDVFLSCLKHEVGYPAMPQGSAKLSDCDIRIIELWIQDGFPNN